MKKWEQKIIPNLWFNGNAKEAVDFYVSVFPEAQIISISYYPKSKEEGLADFQLNMAGEILTIDFEIFGFRFVAINAGPEFSPNPSISFIVGCETIEEIDSLWKRLSEGGTKLMPLDKYFFSERYGWIQDKYNVNWQLILKKPEEDNRPKIVPALLFVKEKSGKTKDARDFYLSVFKNSKEGIISYFEEDTPMGQKKGDVMFCDFKLDDVWIAAMDGGDSHEFDFNEGVSLSIACKDQDEIDYFWEKLTAGGGEESVCGWLKDKYGVSWQVAPENMKELMKKPNAFKTMMKQKKIIIAEY